MYSALPDLPSRRSEWLPALALLAFVALALLLKFRLDHAIDVHWDEFNYLSKIHTHLRGELHNGVRPSTSTPSVGSPGYPRTKWTRSWPPGTSCSFCASPPRCVSS